VSVDIAAEVEAHIQAADSLDLDSEADAALWLDRSKSLLPHLRVSERHTDRLNSVNWRYTPAEQLLDRMPTPQQKIRSAVQSACEILLQALEERRIERTFGASIDIHAESDNELAKSLVELAEIEVLAETLQSANPTQVDVADRYFHWFGKAILLLPEDLKDKFRDEYEGGQFTSKIRAFLAEPRKASPLYDPAKPENQLNQPLAYSFESNFRRYSQSQRQLLVEASQRLGGGVTRAFDPDGDIFVVHGHDEARIHEVQRLLSKLTGKEGVVLREQPSAGQTIIEKFEQHAARSAFAVVLLTADDLGRAKAATEDRERARQNVVFEAGYFVGLLGRSHVALLHESNVELPSDLSGVVYISFAGEWKVDLAREMRAAGIEVDLNQL